MDLAEVQALVPLMPHWLAGVPKVLVTRGPLKDMLEGHWKSLAGSLLVKFKDLAAREEASLNLVLRNAWVLAREKDSPRLASLYLIALEGARKYPSALAGLPKLMETDLPKNGWWTLFLDFSQRRALRGDMPGLPALLNFQLSLAVRSRMASPPSGSVILREIDAYPHVARRDLARAVLANSKNYPLSRYANPSELASVGLKCQKLVLETEGLAQALFGLPPEQLGLNSIDVEHRWASHKAFNIASNNLCRYIQARRWDAFDAAWQALERIPEGADLALFHPRFQRALANPSTGGRPGTLPKTLSNRIANLVGNEEVAGEQLRFLVRPIDRIVAEACRSKSYLDVKATWLPPLDRQALLQSLSPEQIVRLAMARRYDLLPVKWDHVFEANTHQLISRIQDAPIKKCFSESLAEDGVLRTLAKAYTGQHVPIISEVLVGGILRKHPIPSEALAKFLGALPTQAAVSNFLKLMATQPTCRSAAISALGEAVPRRFGSLWLDWLLASDQEESSGTGAWLAAVEALLGRSGNLRQRFVSSGFPVNHPEVFGELSPPIRGLVLKETATSQKRFSSDSWQRLESLAVISLPDIRVPEVLAVAVGWPSLRGQAESCLSTAIQTAEASDLLQIFEGFPGLVQAWGTWMAENGSGSSGGPEGNVLTAMRAAFRPKRFWRALADLPDEEQALAVRSALRILDPLPSRKSLLELGNALGFRWMPTLGAAFAAMREGSGKTGSKLDHLYQTYSLPKKAGGSRTITIPPPWLKRLQRQIHGCLLSPLGAHPCAHGFVKGHDIVSNARNHVGHSLVVGCDIKAAFPSVSIDLVRFALRRDLGATLSWRAIQDLADLTCYAGGLPIGAPTSPALLNRVLLVADNIFSEEAGKRSVSYTRYADDLCFSGDERAKELLPIVRRVLNKVGLVLDPKKTNLFRRGRRQMVTGLVVNDKASTPRRLRRKLRAAVHRAEQGGEIQWHGGGMSTQSLMGRLAFIKMANPEEAGRLIQRLKATLRPKP